MSKGFTLIGLISLVTLIAGCTHSIVSGNESIGNNTENRHLPKVCFEDNCFYVELAITPDEIATGLMFREQLDADKGMLFIFPSEEIHSFWMKNTLIPLDMIWINENKEVVFIEKNAQPCESSSCPSIIPDDKAKYVLEVNGGTSDRIGLATGDEVTFDKSIEDLEIP